MNSFLLHNLSNFGLVIDMVGALVIFFKSSVIH
jgi:hypothetical protein